MLTGIKNIHADHAASHLGKAHGIVNLIRSIPYNAQRKIVALPQDVLLQHNVSHETVLRANCTTDLKEAVFNIASRAKQHLDKVILPIYFGTVDLCVFILICLCMYKARS
jgi:NADH dehydrogenase [ubiquinone] 1 alpha subcomplex assembly factor 6